MRKLLECQQLVMSSFRDQHTWNMMIILIELKFESGTHMINHSVHLYVQPFFNCTVVALYYVPVFCTYNIVVMSYSHGRNLYNAYHWYQGTSPILSIPYRQGPPFLTSVLFDVVLKTTKIALIFLTTTPFKI